MECEGFDPDDCVCECGEGHACACECPYCDACDRPAVNCTC